MAWLSALLALAASEAPGLHLAVDGACPASDEVRAAVVRSLARAGTAWPDGRRIDLRLDQRDTDVRLQLSGADGRVLLARSFRDEAADCAARAETVGLVVARYLESLGWLGEPAPIRPAATATAAVTPRPRASNGHVGLEVGLVVAGGVANAGGDTAIDPGPQLGLRAGRRPLSAVLRAAWLSGDSFRSPEGAGRARVDRIPVSVTALLGGRLGRAELAAGPRLAVEAVRSAGSTDGLRTDTTLAVRAGGEVEALVWLGGPFLGGVSGGLDVALRRVEVQVRDPATSEAVTLAGQDLLVPFVQVFVGMRWNLGR